MLQTMPSSKNYLQLLISAGLSVSIKPNNILWLSPKSLITEDVRNIAKTHKTEILAEIVKTSKQTSFHLKASESKARGLYYDADACLLIPCSECGNNIKLTPCNIDSKMSDDCGHWYHFNCKCGAEGYICQRDYQRWKEHGGMFLQSEHCVSKKVDNS